jgi:hypothetical protein
MRRGEERGRTESGRIWYATIFFYFFLSSDHPTLDHATRRSKPPRWHLVSTNEVDLTRTGLIQHHPIHLQRDQGGFNATPPVWTQRKTTGRVRPLHSTLHTAWRELIPLSSFFTAHRNEEDLLLLLLCLRNATLRGAEFLLVLFLQRNATRVRPPVASVTWQQHQPPPPQKQPGDEETRRVDVKSTPTFFFITYLFFLITQM